MNNLTKIVSWSLKIAKSSLKNNNKKHLPIIMSETKIQELKGF